jgi:Flp pilus assembly pilin Flp
MISTNLTKLTRDETGATVTEFALILPALMVMLMGLLDLAHSMYTAQMLQGAIQQSARSSTIEGAASNAATLDQRVSTAVKAITPGATLTFARSNYRNFTGAGRPEDYDDVNNNNTCDAGEPFEDDNFNGTWDLDPGSSGFGGARDAVLYKVTVSYQRPFPVFAFIPGQSSIQTMEVSTVLRNQPYGLNLRPPVIQRTCT